MSSDMSERLHALYRFFDASGDLLYIGITLNPAGRWKQHREDKPWWEEVADITIETHPDRPSVLEAERKAIIAEHPRYNKTHNTRPTPKPATEQRLAWACCECDRDILGSDGYLQVGCTGAELSEIQKAHREYEEQRRARGSWVPIDWAEFFSLPGPAPWQAVHKGCDQFRETSPYWIEIGVVSTYRELLIWTCHLAEKSWLGNTDWFRLMDRAANAGAPPIEQKATT